MDRSKTPSPDRTSSVHHEEARQLERVRIESVYGDYRTSGRDVHRWNPQAPGNRCILAERLDRISSLIDGLAAPRQVLEVGCGSGEVLRQLKGALPESSTVVGVDLLGERLVEALRQGDLVGRADARRLPFPDGQFDLVAMFTVLSSVLDHQIRRDLAAEALRVLAPEGAILWYDLRYPSTNRSVRALTRRAVKDSFPGCEVRLNSVTLLPPVARRLGTLDRSLYPALSRIPPLRSHLIGLVRRR